MNSGEFLKPYHEGVNRFLGIGPEGGVHNFSLVTPKNVPTHIWGFSVFFPGLESDRGGYLLYSSDQEKSIEPFRAKIPTLTIPDRVKALRIPSDTILQNLWELRCGVEGLPSIVLAYGERYNPTEKVIVLFCVQGMTPEQALRKVQQRHAEAAARFN